MANEFIQPYTGPHTIDLTAIAQLLVDLAPGALRGLQREKPGLDGVVAELLASVPTLGAKAAISSDIYAEFESTHALILQIRAARLLVDKAAEVLAESEAYYEDQRESDIGLIATAIRGAARRKDPSIGAAFEKTLAYYGQVAMKAVKTRRKNQAESAEEPAAGGEGEDEEVSTSQEEDGQEGVASPKAP